MRIMCILFISVLFNIGLNAEYDSANNGSAPGVGIGGTVFETWGFTFRQKFSHRWGIAASAGGWFMNNRGHAGLAVGPTFTITHHTFAKSALPESSLRVYFVGYATGIYHLNTNYERVIDKTVTHHEHSATLGLGAGPGIEYFFTRNFALHLELPWMTKFRIKPKTGVEFSNSYPNVGGGFTYYI